MQIIRANVEHLESLVPLFDAYRTFFGQTAEPERARRYMQNRLERGESRVFLAIIDAVSCGFIQLYPTWSSVNTQKILILNDLYVHRDYRKRGVGRALMEAAQGYSREHEYHGVKLETQVTNNAGQSLYEGLGYQRLGGFYQYYLPTPRHRGLRTRWWRR